MVATSRTPASLAVSVEYRRSSGYRKLGTVLEAGPWLWMKTSLLACVRFLPRPARCGKSGCSAGCGFMLNGNMVAGTSRRGLLVCVGKDRRAQALARPGAKPMEMSERPMEGYVFVDPPPPDERGLRDWLELAVTFVNALPPKLPKPKLRPGRNR